MLKDNTEHSQRNVLTQSLSGKSGERKIKRAFHFQFAVAQDGTLFTANNLRAARVPGVTAKIGAGDCIRVEVYLRYALARGQEADGGEWPIHFYMPVFLAELGVFESTQGLRSEILILHRDAPITPHLEVDTYTWAV